MFQQKKKMRPILWVIFKQFTLLAIKLTTPCPIRMTQQPVRMIQWSILKASLELAFSIAPGPAHPSMWTMLKQFKIEAN
jgi:hypothetical protein